MIHGHVLKIHMFWQSCKVLGGFTEGKGQIPTKCTFSFQIVSYKGKGLLVATRHKEFTWREGAERQRAIEIEEALCPQREAEALCIE
ncbi:unnamed protein product [Citrullus colocynthis]|uniref:Uncharacterized protein n=1 Tax=Citrullus colocynthis TaxID=252529 RepID=A0ABP0XYT3_9ROSI